MGNYHKQYYYIPVNINEITAEPLYENVISPHVTCYLPHEKITVVMAT